MTSHRPKTKIVSLRKCWKSYSCKLLVILRLVLAEYLEIPINFCFTAFINIGKNNYICIYTNLIKK